MTKISDLKKERDNKILEQKLLEIIKQENLNRAIIIQQELSDRRGIVEIEEIGKKFNIEIEENEELSTKIKDFFNKQNQQGKTAFYLACAAGNLEMAQNIVRIAKENDLDIKEIITKADNEGRTPFYRACASGNKDLVEFLIEGAKDGGLDIKEFITKSGNYHRNPLHVASFECHEEIVKLLIQEAKTNPINSINPLEFIKKDNLGRTPLTYAVEKKHQKIADYLRENIEFNWSIEFQQIDTGQGDAAFGGFINHSDPSESVFFMIDGGRQFIQSEIKDRFGKFVNKIKNDHQGYVNIPDRLHLVFRGSKDADHSAGLPDQNDQDLVNSETNFFSYENAAPYTICNVGDNLWQLIGRTKPLNAPDLEIIASNGELKGGYIIARPSDNEKSLGFLIDYNQFRFFTGGDLGHPSEDNIDFGNKNTSISKINHHGSNNSTSATLLTKLDPKSVIISHGDSTQYSHPNANVLNRIEDSSAKFSYMTNPAYQTRGINFLEDYQKTVVAGNGNYITKTNDDGFGGKKPSNKNPLGHITIKISQDQSRLGEYSVEYERKPPTINVSTKPIVTRSKDKRIRDVKDKYKIMKFGDKDDKLDAAVKKADSSLENTDLYCDEEYKFNISDVEISDFEKDYLRQKYLTVKFKQDNNSTTPDTADKISVRIYDQAPSSSVKQPVVAKKRYFRDKKHNDETVSRTQTNYR